MTYKISNRLTLYRKDVIEMDIKEMIKKEIEKVEKEVSKNRSDFNLGRLYELNQLETMIETAEEMK